MPTPEMRTPSPARDYNRAAPGARQRRERGRGAQGGGPAWPVYLLGTAVLFALLLPLDGPISRFLRSIPLKGDLRREIESLQQYGQTLSSIIVALAIWLQDPAHRRRLADLAAAWAVTALFVVIGKGLVGRPRPRYEDPLYFLGPLGQYPVERAVDGHPVGIRHAWEFWSGISSDLWSMPSSHTAYAACLSVVVSTLYPRLRPLMVALVAYVGLARIVTGAHYPSDVLVGGAIGFLVARAAMQGRWGQRLLDRLAGPGRRGASPAARP
jgi:membrane-associated phospholipid phosphatase